MIRTINLPVITQLIRKDKFTECVFDCVSRMFSTVGGSSGCSQTLCGSSGGPQGNQRPRQQERKAGQHAEADAHLVGLPSPPGLLLSLAPWP